MKSIRDALPAPAKARCLVVFLPGAGDGAETFKEHGFVQALRSRGILADVVSANSVMGYYFRGTLSERLEKDVIGPAVTAGYAHVWEVGISMGGLGTLWYAHEHPGQVTDALLLSPFLGDEALLKEIRAAGGVTRWQAPPRAPMGKDTYQRELWRWLQAVLAGKEPGPTLRIGYGSEDKVREGAKVLEDALPGDHVFHTYGPHQWETWQRLFDRFLETGELQRQCGTLSRPLPPGPSL